MTDQTNATTTPPAVQPKQRRNSGGKPIRSLTLIEVDEALIIYEKSIKVNTDLIKSKLSGTGALPIAALKELSKANVQRMRLIMRRIAVLIETGDAAAMELVDKLCKVKPSKATA